MQAFNDSERPVQPGDPRLCTRYSVGVMVELTALHVVLRFGRPRTEETHGVLVLTPAQAREAAMHLWDSAEAADRAMNQAAQAGKGGE